MWTGPNWGVEQPRFVTDLNGDGKGDLVGFGTDGVWTALGKGDGTFSMARQILTSFSSQGWHMGLHPRFVVDLNGDGKADILGFGDNGVSTAISKGDGTFAEDQLVLAQFGVNQGWRVDQHPRFVADLTGDGKADLVGFNNDGVWTALGRGDGTFGPATLVLTNFGVNQGWQVAQHPRFVADLTGDGKADLVGFGPEGVRTALGKGDGTFGTATLVLANFGVNQRWPVDKNPLFLADVTGSGRLDLVGFGDDGVWTASGNGDGTFGNANQVLPSFGVNQGWQVGQHPRFVVDLTGDGKADILGFDNQGVRAALNNGDGTYGEAKLVLPSFGVNQGWQVGQHLRLAVDLNGDGKADIISFGNDAVPRAVLNNGNGTFGPGLSSIADITNQPSSAVQHDVLNQGIFEARHLPIALDDVQTKLNFLNRLEPPLFQLKFDSKDHLPGTSDLNIDVAANSILSISQAIHSTITLNDQPGDLEFAGHKIYFQDLNSSKVTADLDRREPLALVLEIPFEIDGPAEIKVEGGDALDLRLFKINLRLEITRQKQWLDLFSFVWEIENALTEGTADVSTFRNGFGLGGTYSTFYYFTVKFRGETFHKMSQESPQVAKQAVRDALIECFITTNVSVNAWWSEIPWSWFNDGEDRVRRAFNSKIYDKLKKELNSATTSSSSLTSLLGTMVKKLLGIDESCFITSLSSDSHTLYIDYVVLPRP